MLLSYMYIIGGTYITAFVTICALLLLHVYHYGMYSNLTLHLFFTVTAPVFYCYCIHTLLLLHELTFT